MRTLKRIVTRARDWISGSNHHCSRNGSLPGIGWHLWNQPCVDYRLGDSYELTEELRINSCGSASEMPNGRKVRVTTRNSFPAFPWERTWRLLCPPSPLITQTTCNCVKQIAGRKQCVNQFTNDLSTTMVPNLAIDRLLACSLAGSLARSLITVVRLL